MHFGCVTPHLNAQCQMVRSAQTSVTPQGPESEKCAPPKSHFTLNHFRAVPKVSVALLRVRNSGPIMFASCALKWGIYSRPPKRSNISFRRIAPKIFSIFDKFLPKSSQNGISGTKFFAPALCARTKICHLDRHHAGGGCPPHGPGCPTSHCIKPCLCYPSHQGLV